MSNTNTFIESMDLFEEYHLEKRKALYSNKVVRLNALISYIRSYDGDLYKEYKQLNLDKDVRARDALHKADELHFGVKELINEKNAIRFLNKVNRFEDYLLILQKVDVENLDMQIQNIERYFKWITDLKKDDIQLLINDKTDDAYFKALTLYEETMRKALSGAEDTEFKGIRTKRYEFTFCEDYKVASEATNEAVFAANIYLCEEST